MRKTKKGWRVRYVPFGGKRQVSRYFPTERAARSFYGRLFLRAMPPESQAIERLL